jgi:hypothetical protein
MAELAASADATYFSTIVPLGIPTQTCGDHTRKGNRRTLFPFEHTWAHDRYIGMHFIEVTLRPRL